MSFPRTVDVVEAETSKSYGYEPLDQSKQSIRLLSIHPLPKSGTVECTLRSTELADPNRTGYNALSYEWGVHDPSSQGIIHLNGELFRVRRNLYEFLLLASTKLVAIRRDIWIDAICINQKDVQERNHQVCQMGEIYRQAEVVYVWLGQRVQSTIDSPHYGSSHRRTEKRGENVVLEMIHRSYWSRLWILQELAMARKPRFIYGTKIYPRSLFDRLMSRSNFKAPTEYSEHALMALELKRGLGFPRDDARSPLFTMVLGFSHYNCTDMRDKVYGLLALASDADELPVDYDIDLCELFFRVFHLYTEPIYPADAIVIQRAMSLRYTMLRNWLKCSSDPVANSTLSRLLIRIHVRRFRLTKRRKAPLQLVSALDRDNEVHSGETSMTLFPKDLVCLFDFESNLSTADLHRHRKPEPRLAIVFRRTTSGSYRYLALCKISGKKQTPLAQTRLARSARMRDEYHLYDVPSFRAAQCAGFKGERGTVSLPPLAFLLVLRICKRLSKS